MDEVRVGIVMPCINLWDKYTRSALESVVAAIQEAIKKNIYCDILLLDNGSTDNTQVEAPKWFKAHYNETVASTSYQRNETMWGFQKSVNFGVNEFFNDKRLDKQKFDYVLVLNNDIVLHEAAIWRLVERFKRDGASMATCLDATGECLRDPANISKLDDVEKEACPETQNPCFSAFMIDRRCWDQIGEFDEIFAPAYYEDNDYHWRIKVAGHMALTYPPAMFFHWGSATQIEALGNGKRLTDSSNQHMQYVKKWGGNPGQEIFKTPYNNHALDIKSTKQNKKV